MIAPAHIGLEHPNLTWLVVVGILAFVSGLGVNLYRSSNETETSRESGTGDEFPE